MRSRAIASLAKFGRGMKLHTGRRIAALSVILIGLLASVLLVGLRGSQAQSGGQRSDPDYSQIADFTGGRTHLLRNDDLVMTFNYQSNNETRGTLFTAGTAASQGVLLNDRRIIPQGPGCTNSAGCQYDYHQFVGNRPAIGRFFNTDRDTVVQYPILLDGYPYFVSLVGKTVTTPVPSAGLTWKTAQNINFVTGGDSFLAAVGDFNQDGYDDLLMAWSNTSAFPSNPKMCVATAVDVNDPGKGFKFGPVFSTADQAGIRELAVGDFNGDRQPDVAYLSVGQDAQLNLFTFAVDPSTLAISAGGSVSLYKLASVAVTTALTMTPGKFTPAVNRQIAVGFQVGNRQNFKVQIADFDPKSLQPKLMKTLDVPDASNDPVLKLKAGRLNWSSPYDQIVWMSSTIDNGTRLEVLTVDPASLDVTVKANSVFSGDADSNADVFARDIALGNFDHMQQSTADPTKKERDPDLQIAFIALRVNRQNGQIGTLGVAILDVSDDLSTITTASYTAPDQSFVDNRSMTEASIVAGDLQGRSFRLGAGYKITVDHVQPSVVLAAPPMHADYISAGLGKVATVLNLSVAPDAFHSEYEQTESTDASASQTGTTSSSFSGEEKISGSFAIGEVGSDGDIESGVKIKDSFTAKQDIKTSTDTINGAFNSQEFDISQETGLSDVVWFKDTSFYLYVYPVIGQKVCPADKPNCTDAEKIPMQIMFSAPKATTVQRLASDTLEWYQPPWEYGNLLSYPAGLPQLKQYLPDIQLLTADTTVFATDDAAATLKTTWSNGRTTGQNIDHEELYSEDNDLSVEGKVGGEGFGFAVKASAGLELNFGGSDGTRTLTDSETKFNAARGITVAKPGTFPDPFSYKYFFSPYIFGKMKPVGYTDPINSTADLLSFGTLRSAYTANPVSTGSTNAGAWWTQSDYKKFPDVAVNHPNRWSYGAQGKPSNGVIPSNCVAIDNFSMDCVTPTEREPDNPWRDAFHDMRGLFITNALNPPNSNALMAPGAQLETATAGDQLNVWTRVYNYSFKPMPAGTKVKVRFYGMPLDDQNLPVNGGGGSFQIGQDVELDPIAPFSNDPNAPVNWVLAKTTFDTTGRENQALAFWVAVWMEDAGGNLVAELPGHGLSGKPAGGATPSFNDVTALEEMVDNPLKTSADDPAKLSFSNNVGFYRSIFHILPKGKTAVPGAIGGGELSVEKVEVSGVVVKPGHSVEGSVTLRTGAQDLFGVTVYFYDGDPAAGGRLVDAERVARLRAGGRQKVSINFRPQACGSHQLFVRVAPGKAYAVTGRASQSVQIDCPAPVCASQVCLKSPQYYALNLGQLPKGQVTIAGGGLVPQVNTDDTAKMRMLLQGGTATQKQFNQQFVTTQLNLLRQGGLNPSALQSNLLCYKLNFQPVLLTTGATLSPSTTLGDLLAQAQQAARSNNILDMRIIANLMETLNGNDPSGRCR